MVVQMEDSCYRSSERGAGRSRKKARVLVIHRQSMLVLDHGLGTSELRKRGMLYQSCMLHLHRHCTRDSCKDLSPRPAEMSSLIAHAVTQRRKAASEMHAGFITHIVRPARSYTGFESKEIVSALSSCVLPHQRFVGPLDLAIEWCRLLNTIAPAFKTISGSGHRQFPRAEAPKEALVHVSDST